MGKNSGKERWITLGPWGGGCGDDFIFKPDRQIMEITVWHGELIHSILFESKSCDDVLGSSIKIGGEGGKPSKFCIDSSVEQISSISLTYNKCWGDDYQQFSIFEEGLYHRLHGTDYLQYRGDAVLASLCLTTNRNQHGPFGREGRDSVSIPIQGGVIAGFHGRSGKLVDAIGLLIAPKIDSFPNSQINDVGNLHSIQDPNSAPTQLKGKISNEEELISFGPWGGENGVDWAFKASGPTMQMSICYGEVINSILFQSRSCDGFVIGSPEKIGGSGGHMTETFCIESPVEQLWSINLTYGDYNGEVAITSLCFCTNLKKYGPFGLRSGAFSESIPLLGGLLVGLHGRGGTYLTAIGMIVTPNVNSLPCSEEYFSHLRSVIDPDYAPTQLKDKIPGEEGLKSLGPWGASYGLYWAYKVNAPIIRITIAFTLTSRSCIKSILCEGISYDDIFIGCSIGNGRKTGGIFSNTFYMDTSKEQLTSITLVYDSYDQSKGAISSICFYTNLHQYGPFGEERGRSSVSIPLEGGVLRGFYGHINVGFDSEEDSSAITGIGIFVGPKFSSLHSIQDQDSTPPEQKLVLPSPLYLHSIQDRDSAPTKQKGMITNEEGWTSLGPWGGEAGFAWAYKVNSPVMHMSICYGETNIESIMCGGRGYDGIVIGGSGKICCAGGHGTETFCIDTSQEQFTSISLTYGNGCIKSLCFNTNLMRYGPFGLETGASSISIPLEGRVFCGFHGRSSERHITAIGIFFVAPKIHSLHPIQDPDSGPTLLKMNQVKPEMLEIPTSNSMWSLRYLIPKLKANFCGSKPQKLENVILHDGASSSGTTKKDDHHGGTPSPSSEMIHKDIQLVDSSNQNMEMSEDNQHGGALSPTSKMIHSDLILLDTAFEEAEESMRCMKVKIIQAHEKFKELQIFPTTERASDKLQRADSDKKEIRKAIAKLKVQIHSYKKIRSANSNTIRRNWDNINGTNDVMMHFFHKEPEVEQTDDCGGIVNAFRVLPQPLCDCLLCFFNFPPMVPIKRTPMIYLWIAQGYISQYLQSEVCVWDVEVHAGKIFDELIAKGFIEAIYQKCSLEPDSCMMRPSVRSSLYKEAERRGFTSNGNLDLNTASLCGGGDDLSGNPCLVNVGETIINFHPKIFKNMKHIQSLYLGRWQSSITHHIELKDTKILYGLNNLNNLTFLSLRGISMITELPTFILELKKLMILDVRACHNLEVIPDMIGLLKSLTHLDMSECYYLENMPKSLAKLSNLQVLKGFLIGDANKSKESCSLCYLSELPKLRKLNIHISVDSVEDLHRLRDFEYLKRFEGLEKLIISWGRVQARAEIIAEAFRFPTLPPRLQKLILQCFPLRTLSNWLMPGKLKELKKLYIIGGKLRDLGEILKRQEEKWAVEILRLEYLSEIELYWGELRTAFPKLIYLHQGECPKFMNFPCNDKGVWLNKMEINTHVQLRKYIKTRRLISSSSMLGSGSASALEDCVQK